MQNIIVLSTGVVGSSRDIRCVSVPLQTMTILSTNTRNQLSSGFYSHLYMLGLPFSNVAPHAKLMNYSGWFLYIGYLILYSLVKYEWCGFLHHLACLPSSTQATHIVQIQIYDSLDCVGDEDRGLRGECRDTRPMCSVSLLSLIKQNSYSSFVCRWLPITYRISYGQAQYRRYYYFQRVCLQAISSSQHATRLYWEKLNYCAKFEYNLRVSDLYSILSLTFTPHRT